MKKNRQNYNKMMKLIFFFQTPSISLILLHNQSSNNNNNNNHEANYWIQIGDNSGQFAGPGGFQENYF
jgi:hypothetical protein